jgi:hypothetical protein
LKFEVNKIANGEYKVVLIFFIAVKSSIS